MNVVVVLRSGQTIDLDVDDKATVGDIRAAAAAIIGSPVRTLTLNGSVLADGTQVLPAQHTVLHEMRATGWFLQRHARYADTPFHRAARCGRHACLSVMLRYYPQGPMMKGDDGWTPFHYAVDKGHDDCVVLFLRYCPEGALAMSDDGWTPLHWAARGGHTACLALLLQHCPEGAMVKDNRGETAFHFAARGGHSACLSLLRQYCPQGRLQYCC